MEPGISIGTKQIDKKENICYIVFWNWAHRIFFNGIYLQHLQMCLIAFDVVGSLLPLNKGY